MGARNGEDADSKIENLYRQVCDLDGREITALRTKNSITVCRNWPERHVQIVVLYMKSITEHLLIADLDCTAMAYRGGQVLTCSRSRRALRTHKNVVPDSMLLNRQDETKNQSRTTNRDQL